MTLMSKIKIYSAISNDEFYVMYQPIFNNITQLYDGAEALLRWRNKAGVEINPAEFIKLAECSGCIIPLTLHLFHLVRSDIKSWPEGKDIKISLNISSIHFQSQYFINDILSLTHEAPANVSFIIELTERFPVHNDKQILQIFNRLKMMGISLALDDFGSGYSNFDLLAKFHFDYVKLAGDLLENIHSNERALSIVMSSLSLISELGAISVIEHIETQMQYDLLIKNSCLFQGFLFSKPLSNHEFLCFMQMNNLEFSR
ncbi:EAL domain-containing protein [Citrobacter portucalensis]|uniref:EAL domain-containing protein n=1 Tax=Citrobacter portucalensis TaxID=1639133 RepID=A0AAW5WB55_9ENTR|nr:EAL domain-containing protein [Citrobacter portucalensis]MCX9004406.1 EAL domain-containing protein [Citrobacter portucalensis]